MTADVCCRGGYSLKEFLTTSLSPSDRERQGGLDGIIPEDIPEKFHPFLVR